MKRKRISLETEDDFTQITLFDCGDREISDYLKVAYEDDVTRYCSTTLFVDENDKILGFYSIKKSEIETKIFIDKYGEEIEEPYIAEHPALHIYRFAVHKDYQGKYIGTRMMEDLINNAWAMNERMIFVQSVNQSKDFYEKVGFTVLIEENEVGKETDLVFMYLDLLSIENWEKLYNIDF